MEILSKDYVCFLLSLEAVQRSWELRGGGEGADLKLIVDRVAADVYDELDYRKEAANGKAFKETLHFLGFVTTPQVLDEYTTGPQKGASLVLRRGVVLITYRKEWNLSER